MRYDEFVAQARRRTGLSSNEESERITAAVLETLGERIYKTEREDLAAQLPSELRKYLSTRPESESFHLEEFYNRVRSRADVSGTRPR